MITVLRLGHRAGRDPRISTHCALVARAFGASKILYTGEHDSEMEDSVNSIVRSWGGPFEIKHEKSWRQVITSWNGLKTHLTMYGIPLQERIAEVRKSKNLLVIIGGSKVPYEVYQLVDHNISVTSQPHSEVAALAVLLHEYMQGKESRIGFSGAKLRVVPKERGKQVDKV